MNIFRLIPEAYKRFNSEGFYSCQFGFRPFSLLTNSGVKINLDNISEMNYIIDPELKYIQTIPGGKFSILSITQRIDIIFNMICKKINDVIGDKIGLKFFLRRTLAGCEFGICFDAIMKVDDPNNSLLKDYYCLIDKDPLLSFTIFIKNESPILAGILIIVLVYVGVLLAKTISWVSAFLVNFSKFILKKCLRLIINYTAEKTIEKILTKLIQYLEGIVAKQRAQIVEIDEKLGQVLNNLFLLFSSIGLDGLGNVFSAFLGCKIKIKTKFGRFIN